MSVEQTSWLESFWGQSAFEAQCAGSAVPLEDEDELVVEPPASPLEDVEPPVVELAEVCTPLVDDVELFPLVVPLLVCSSPLLLVEAVVAPPSAGSIESRLTIDAHAAHAMNATATAAWPKFRRIARE